MKRKEAFNILGVSENANEGDLKKAYKKLVAEHHPDKHGNTPEAEKKFKDINLAYEIVSNKTQAEDDRPQGFNPFGEGFGNPFVGGIHGFDHINMDFFADFFGGNPPSSSQQRQQIHLEDIIITHHIDLKTACLGGTLDIEYDVKNFCVDCTGSGYDLKNKCNVCNGTGKVFIQKRMGGTVFKTQMICNVCSGKGSTQKCPKCNGKAFSIEKNNIKVNLRPTAHNGTIRLERLGNKFNNFSSSLIILIEIKNDNNEFKLINNDIHTVAQLKLGDLLCGSNIEVKCIDDSIVSVIIPKNSKVNDTIRILGQGVKNAGDHIVTLDLIYPQNVSDEYKEILNKIY